MNDTKYLIVPGDPDQWWNVPIMPSAPIEQTGPIIAVAPFDVTPIEAWLAAIGDSGGPLLARAEATEQSEQPVLQRPVDIVIDGLLGRVGSTPVSKPDQERLGKALDHASKGPIGRPGADAGVGRAIGSRHVTWLYGSFPPEQV